MMKHNPDNERIKRQYFAYLKEAKRHSEATVDGVAKALARFEADTKCRDFKKFQSDQAIAFKRHLADQKAQRTGEKLSKATLHSTLASLKSFFHWLAGQPGYKSKLQYSDADYFNLSEKDVRVAIARRDQVGPTLEQVRRVIETMPHQTAIEKRDRALIAFTLLTGARDSAITSFKLKHVNLVEGSVFQDARDVKTKFSKTFTTHFFPVGDGIATIVHDWVNYLRTELLWGNDDPLFPTTRVEVSAARRFEAVGLERTHWRSAAAIRGIFKAAFVRSGLAYFNPHSFRNTLVRLGQDVCQSPEDFKAWSQNLGHDKVLTTFMSYGQVQNHRQAEILKALAKPRLTTPAGSDEFVQAVIKGIRESQHQGGFV
ncbi:MAG: tyrosine-type recombinase/integrase [Burkholderiaceae bacterium]